ncbi:neurofilament medium polypeptide-like, partial [Sinocyclocheilus grahami]|uniref:neurofilament medium polypeptide-like n=1 Tax=Sinocyclocheilus grahami TaxID=75366 RepID=UPI0007AC5EAE
MSEDKLKLLSCHFTWDLQKEDADLNFLEVKVRERLAVKCEYGGNLKQREFNFLAFIKHLQGFNDEAIKNLQLAKKEHPDDDSNVIVTYGNLAWVHSLMGNVTEAETYTEKVNEILRAFPAPSPTELHREVQSEKAWSLLKFSRKTYIRAKESFLEALQKEPDDKEWNTGFAFSLFRLEGLKIGQYKRVRFEESPAVLQLKKALNLDLDNAMIHVYLGLKCYKNTKNVNSTEAWQYMKQALTMAPDNLSVVLHVAKFMKKEQFYDKALKVLLEMLKKVPDSSRLHHEIANNYRWKAIKLLDGEESRYSTVSDAHISVPYIYRQSPIYTLPCVKRQGGATRKAEPQYKFVEEIITETTREDVEISDTGSDKSGEGREGDKPDEESSEKDAQGETPQEVEDTEEPAMENGNEANPELETEETEVKPSDEKEDESADSEVQKDADSEPTQDSTEQATDEQDKDEELDTKGTEHKDLKNDVQGKVEEPEEENKQAEETEKDVPKPDLSEKQEMPDKSKTIPKDKPSQEPQDPEATTEVKPKPGGETVGVTSPKTEDAKISSEQSTTAKSTEKEKELAPEQPVEEDTPKPDKQATPEHTESGKQTTEEDTSAKKDKSDTVKEETKKYEPKKKDQEDNNKLTEKPVGEKQEAQSSKDEKEHKPEESVKDSKVELVDNMKTEKGESIRAKEQEKTQKELSKDAEEQSQPEKSKKQEDSKSSSLASVTIEKGETGKLKETEKTQEDLSKVAEEKSQPQKSQIPEDKKSDSVKKEKKAEHVKPKETEKTKE